MKKWRSMDLFGSVENLFHHSSSNHSDSGKNKSFRQRLSSLSAKDDSNLNRNSNRDSSDGNTEVSENQMIQRCVIVQRDDKGYGLTVSGDNPVFVQSVKAEGAAARCGVQEGDKILKVNGNLVTNRNHIDVVKLIKSGPLVALTLLGKPPANSLDKSATIITPQHLTSSSNRVTAPQPVDPEIDKELWQQKVHTTRAMLEQAREDQEKLKRNYIRSPSEKLSEKLLEKERTVKKLEEQLKTITGIGDLSPPHTLSSMSDTEKSPIDQNSNTSWLNKTTRHSKQASVPVNLHSSVKQSDTRMTSVSRSKSDVTSRRQAAYISQLTGSNALAQQTSSLPSSVPTISDAGSLSDSPPTSPSISPTPSHPSNRRDMDDLSSSSKVDSGIEDSSGLSNQTNIITIDDEDINSEEEILDGKIQRSVSPSFYQKLQKSETGDAGPFSDISLLEKKPAHLAIFLHYLISNSDPSPVFFYVISDMYSHAQGSSKDMKKWAYEIYSTFLTPSAPLAAGLGDSVLNTIDSALTTNSSKMSTENSLRTVFDPARQAVKGIVQDLLADFRQKRDLGLGSIYGTHELRDDMDRQSEMKMIEKYLINHLSLLVGDDKSDREQAMGWAIATFLRHTTAASKSTHSGVLERVQSFVMKDKRSLKFPITKSKTKAVKGHQFTLQHYYMVTFCSVCNSLIWGVGYQGYQCNICEMNVHRQCVDDIQETCTGKQKKREKRASGMIPVIPNIRRFSNPNPSAGSSFTVVNEALREATMAAGDGGKGPEIVTQPIKRDEDAEFADTLQFIAGLPAGHSVKSIVNRYEKPKHDAHANEEDDVDEKDKSKKSKDIGRSESMKGRGDKKHNESKKRSKSDVDADDSAIKALNQSGSSSTSSLGGENNIEGTEENVYEEIQTDDQTDSDLDVENDLPSLKQLFGEDTLKKLKPKEKKRQEVLNELIHTERAHVRNLKILDRLFFRPMAAETSTQDLAKQLLPNIHQMIRLHSTFNTGLKLRRKDNPVISEVGDLFLKRFSGEDGEKFKKGCSTFCQGQSFALDALRKQQRKEQRLSQFLNDAESNPLCRRLQLKDLIPTQFQRLTKYPLLIENLLKYTSTNTDEHRNLTLALEKSKGILAAVNHAVKDYENSYRLKILQKKMEKKLPQESQETKRRQLAEDMKNLDLSQHKLVYEGELTWRLRPNRLIDMHVILLEDILVLLQKQDDNKLVLKCQSTNVHMTSDPSQSSRSDTVKGYTHSPILKLQNLLSRFVATDKKGFFVINTSEAGPQIYELIAATQDSRKKWHNLINTWSDLCKNNKKSQKPASPAKPSGEITTPQPEEITEIRSRIKIRAPAENLSRAETNTQESNPPRESASSEILETAQVQSEPDLVQPAEVKVSGLVVAQSKPVLTPLANAGKGRGVNVPIPMSQLKEMAEKMNEILRNLLAAVGSTEEERDKLRIELKAAQDQLNVLRAIQRSAMEAEQSSQSRPASMVSVASSVSEHDETTEGEQLTEDEDDTAQESDHEMIVIEQAEQVETMDTDVQDVAQSDDAPSTDLQSSLDQEPEVPKFDDPGSSVDDPTGIDETDTIVAESAVNVHSAPSQDEELFEDCQDTVEDRESGLNIMDSSDSSASDKVAPVSDAPMETSTCSNLDVDNNEKNEAENIMCTSSSEVVQTINTIDSIEGANFSDSDSTVTPGPYFSEMGESETDTMNKSDATLVGSINSILSDSETSSNQEGYDSERTNEKLEETKSDQSNKANSIEI